MERNDHEFQGSWDLNVNEHDETPGAMNKMRLQGQWTWWDSRGNEHDETPGAMNMLRLQGQ